jgi:hypothetical protein
MTLGEFEPEVWIPARAGVGKRGVIGLAELAAMEVIHGPRRASLVTYDAWLKVLRSVRPGFEFRSPRRLLTPAGPEGRCLLGH